MAFRLILYMLVLIRVILLPLVYTLSFILPGLKRRIEFEKNNSSLPVLSDVAFEVSSEGELEQVLPLIFEALDLGQIVQLAYASESVHVKVQKLASSQPNLHVLALPIISRPLYFLKWMRSSKFIMCRYDFYPELILAGCPRNVEFGLVWASLKGKLKLGWYLKSCYKSFDYILPATNQDKLRFLNITKNTVFDSLDLRILQISKRLESAQITLNQVREQEIFMDFVRQFQGQTIILGSFWDSELEIFENKEFQQKIRNGEILVVIAPHVLAKDSLSTLKKSLLQKDFRVHFANEKVNFCLEPGVIISDFKGILCEFYTLFDFVYVGGGFGRSIHSVMEPYLAGCGVICGPKVHRSTEYDLVVESEPDALNIIETLDSFYKTLKSVENITRNPSALTSFVEEANSRRKNIKLL